MDNAVSPSVFDKLLWAVWIGAAGLLSATVMTSSFAYGVGYALAFFLVSAIFSAVIWATAKRTWAWYNWLNAAAIIATGLMLANAFLPSILLDLAQP